MKRPINKKASQSVLIKRKPDTILDSTNQMDTIEEKNSFHQWYMEFWDDQLAKEFRWYAKEEAEKVKREMIKELEKAEAKAEKAAEELAQKVKREMTERLENAQAKAENAQAKAEKFEEQVHLMQKKEEDRILRNIQDGLSLKLIARFYDLPLKEVRQLAREHGIDPVED